ncbi:hypothetical protein [Plantactinospora sp. GCM10030261]|uniref:hypothetical protein n=1 Tax=Plantactinospora sp. GCM10030261 TaxID=3273420 RepID=UPI00360E940E
MSTVLPILLFGLAGALLGGVISLRRQGAGTGAVVLTAGLALLATVGGLLWLLGGDR